MSVSLLLERGGRSVRRGLLQDHTEKDVKVSSFLCLRGKGAQFTRYEPESLRLREQASA